MKKKILSFLLLIGSIALLTSCDSNSGFFWDNLGGGGTAQEGSLSNTDGSNYKQEGVDNNEDLKDYTYVSNSSVIVLDSLTKGDYEGYSVSKKNKLTITTAGIYELTGTLNGCVSVDAIAGDVTIILNNATITTTEETASAAIVFKGSDTDTVGKRVLTLKENTVNTLSDSTFNTEANDGDEAVIQAKKTTSLVINGKGKLVVDSKTEEGTAIKLKETLTIVDATIEVTSLKNGIKANKKMVLDGATIKVTAANDGIKTDMEAETAEEATLYASSSEYGYMYIKNTNLDITSGDDGLVANNCMVIDNTEANTIKVTTNGGAPRLVSESSKNKANGKAIKVAGITLVSGTTETDYKANYENNYGLVINGGNYEINSNSDAISSKGNTVITGGTFNISTGDDGIHSEYITRIGGGNITIVKSYEGIEGAKVEITGGTIDLTASDDGINAANGDLNNYSFSLYISGGTLHVNSSGDGLDSNGTLTITGGVITVDGPTSNGDGALDSDSGILVNGGTVLAVGSSGMVETPGKNSTQPYININLSSTQAADTTIKLLASDKTTVLFEFTTYKQFQSLVLSTPDLTIGNTYYVMVGQTEYECKLTATGFQSGTVSGMGGGPGGQRPGGPGRF